MEGNPERGHAQACEHTLMNGMKAASVLQNAYKESSFQNRP